MKTYAEKRFFKWQEDDVAVSIRAKSGSYGGGSEVFVVTDGNTIAYGIDSYNQSYFPETAPTIKTNGGGDSFPKVIVFRDDVTIKIDEEDVAFTLGARDFKGVQCISYQNVTGCLSQGAHPGSYNGQDAYNDMLVTDESIINRKWSAASDEH